MTDKISEERKERVFRSMKKLTAYREIQNLMGRCAAACNFKQSRRYMHIFQSAWIFPVRSQTKVCSREEKV